MVQSSTAGRDRYAAGPAINGADHQVTWRYLSSAILAVAMSLAPVTARSSEQGTSCRTTVVTVDGTSMSPLIADGTKVRVISGGPHCAEPLDRREVVVFRSESHQLPLLKLLLGLPGDRIAVRQGEIFINDDVVKNDEGQPYQLSGPRAAMIDLYVHDYGGVIPPDQYLVMGENPAGTTDSSRFGYVARDHIIGKMIDE